MQDGIYHVTFSSNSNDFGSGIAVFKGQSVNGGDHGYLYTGSKSGQGGQFNATLTIRRWDPAVSSVFGPIDEFTLELSGSDSGADGFIAQGTIQGQPTHQITIRGKFLSAAT